MDNNNILQKLEGLESRYEEVSTLITDPDVIADQPRYVKLTKEWKDLGDIMDARKRYINCHIQPSACHCQSALPHNRQSVL